MIRSLIVLLCCVSVVSGAVDMIEGTEVTSDTVFMGSSNGTASVMGQDVVSGAVAYEIPTDNLFLHYEFDEFTNAAGWHVDSSPRNSSQHYPDVGAKQPTWTSTCGGGIYGDNGDQSIATTGYGLYPNANTAVTVIVWCKADVSNQIDAVWSGSEGYEYMLYYTAANAGILAKVESSAGIATAWRCGTNIIHFAMTWDTVSDDEKVYTNGSYHTHIAAVSAIVMNTAGGLLNRPAQAWYMQGYLWEVVVYTNHACSASEIQAHFDGTKEDYPPWIP